MIIFTAFPNRNVNDSTALSSKWSSVHQPIMFGARRNDANVVQVQYLNGVFRVLLASAPPSGLVGTKAWLKSGATSAEVTITGVSGNQLTVTGNIAPATTGGYINFTGLRRNYYVSLRVYGVNDANVYTLLGTHEVRPAADGSFEFDVHGYLKTYADLGDAFLYNSINKKQTRQGSRFNISYSEVWSGSSTPYSSMSTATLYYWANGIKQLQQRYNFNLGQFVLFPTISTAKFLSDFEKPTYFPGFPFSLSFIWSDRVAGRQLQRVEDNFSTTQTTNLDAAQGNAVNRMMLAGSYPTSVKQLDVWLNDNGIVRLPYVVDGYVSPNFVKDVPAKIPPLTE